MAEAVRNNVRKRRLPQHLRQDYYDDNFQPSHPFNSRYRDPNKTNNQTLSFPKMIEVLAQFVNNINKKYNQSHVKNPEKQEQLPPKKQMIQNKKIIQKIQRISKQERRSNTLKNNNNQEIKNMNSYIEASKKQNGTNKQSRLSSIESKQNKNQNKTIEAEISKKIPFDKINDIQSMSRVSKQQYLKMIQSGYNSKIKNQSIQMKNVPKINQGQQRHVELPQQPKLFKRASYHIGIAYKIHIQNIKQSSKNHSPEQFDPTYISKKMRLENIQQPKKQVQEGELLRLQKQALLRQKQQQALKLAALQKLQQKKRQIKSQQQKFKTNQNNQNIINEGMKQNFKSQQINQQSYSQKKNQDI